MTYTERNQAVLEPITKLVVELTARHDKYTSSSKILTEEEWRAYIDEMRGVADKRKGTSLENIAAYMAQYFLDDTEYVQKELRKINDKL